MARGLPTLIACSALALLAGCGSSKSSPSTSSPSTLPRTTAAAGFKAPTAPKYGTPSSSAPVRSGSVQIAYRNITIQPDTLRVKVGSTITCASGLPSGGAEEEACSEQALARHDVLGAEPA